MKNDDLLNLIPKKDLKKPLIYGAIGFLIFIIIVIIVAIFQNSSSKTNNEIIPPEQPKENVKIEKQFQILPIEEVNNSVRIEETPKQFSKKEENITIKEEANNTPLIKKDIKHAKKNENEKVDINKKPIEKVKVNTPKFKKENVKNIGNYYIQVAALLKNAKPNPKFLEIIKKQGFNYKFYHTAITKNGNKIKVTKILIGPFKNRQEAKKALNKVKVKITQNAFIFKVRNGI